MTVIPSSLHSSNFPTQRQAALAVVTGTTRLKRLTLKNPLSYWAATVGDNFTNHVPDGGGLGVEFKVSPNICGCPQCP